MKKNTKKRFSTIILLFVMSFTALGQTFVSGGIFTNTTWTLVNSPYIATDTVVVFPGVTLTIQPGVVVKFDNNVQLEIRQATINAIGTLTDSITFTSNSGSPTIGIWDGIEMNQSSASKFYYCNFKYADKSIYPSNMTGALRIKNSFFSYNNKGFRGLSSATVYVDSCNFRNNIDGINGNAGGYKINNSSFINNQNGLNNMESSTLKNCIIDSNSVAGINFLHQGDSIISCEIKYNGFGIKSDYGGGIRSWVYKNVVTNNTIGLAIYTQKDTIFCNEICNNSTYNVENLIPFGSKNITLANNYWCTNDSTIIPPTIYDGYDNSSLGLVFLSPIDTLQCYLGTGIQNSLIQNISFSIYPNPVSDNLTVTLSTNISTTEIKIYNMLGELEYSSAVTKYKTDIDVSNFTKGMHIIQISVGNKIGRQKFIRK